MEQKRFQEHRQRRDPAQLRALLGKPLIDAILRRHEQGATVRAIAKEAHVRRDVVSDVLNTPGRPPLRRGQRTKKELARRAAVPAPPTAMPSRPSRRRVAPARGRRGDMAETAWRYYAGPCDHRHHPDCEGHSVADVALSLRKNYARTRELLVGQAEAHAEVFPQRRGRRRPPDHPLSTLPGKGGA